MSVVIPCLNEEENIQACVSAAPSSAGEERPDRRGDRRRQRLRGPAARSSPPPPAPPSSTSNAAATGVPTWRAWPQAQGEYVVMADADLTYDFNDIPRFVRASAGGRRSRHGRPDGQHRTGSDAVAAPLRRQPAAHRPAQRVLPDRRPRCPLRDAGPAPRRAARLGLRTTGMEFASEMVVRAAKEGLVIDEVPIRYSPRGGTSKLSSFRDGWRHLRYLLVHSPFYLFIVPGAVLCVLGVLASALVLSRPAPVRAPVGSPHPDRRVAADHRRRAGPRARSLRRGVRHLLHG